MTTVVSRVTRLKRLILLSWSQSMKGLSHTLPRLYTCTLHCKHSFYTTWYFLFSWNLHPPQNDIESFIPTKSKSPDHRGRDIDHHHPIEIDMKLFSHVIPIGKEDGHHAGVQENAILDGLAATRSQTVRSTKGIDQGRGNACKAGPGRAGPTHSNHLAPPPNSL